MSRNEPLPARLEPGTTDTVELTELYGPEPGGIFDFLDRSWAQATIKTCWGDLRVMVDALEDYADILEGAVDDWGLTGYHAAAYTCHAARCRKIASKYAAIGYGRDKALQNCHKRRQQAEDDVGEEALVLMDKRSRWKAEAGVTAHEEGMTP